MNDYAEQLGYRREIDLVFDHGDYGDLSNLLDSIINVCINRSPKDAVMIQVLYKKHLSKLIEQVINEIAATDIMDEYINEYVGLLVDGNANLKADCIRRD